MKRGRWKTKVFILNSLLFLKQYVLFFFNINWKFFVCFFFMKRRTSCLSSPILFPFFLFADLSFQLFSCLETFPASLDFRRSNSAVLKLFANFKSLPARLNFRRRLFFNRNFFSVHLTVLRFAAASQLLADTISFPLSLNSCCSVVF